MKIQFYNNYNMWYVTPALTVMYERDYYLSIDIMWIRWGVGIVLIDKMGK